MLVVLLLLVIAGLILVNWYRERYVKYAGIPGPLELPIIKAVIKNEDRIYDWFLELGEKLGHVFTIAIPGFSRMVIVTDPASVVHILATNFDNYPKGPFIGGLLRPLFGHGIFATDGDEWHVQRKIASHMFKMSSIKAMAEVFQSHGQEVIRILESNTGQAIDTQHLFSSFTLASFSEIAFGEHFDARGTHREFAQAFNEATRATDLRFLIPFSNYLPFLPNERRLQRALSVLNPAVNEIVRRRKEDPKRAEKEDLLSLYTGMTGEDGKPFTDVQLRDFVLNFVIAGRDTTAQTLTWLFYNVAKNPQVEAKLVAEIQEHLDGTEPVDFETVKPLKYLKACIDETLRLYPAVPLDLKYSLKDDVLPSGHKIPAGTAVGWAAWPMGRHAALWDKPLEFIPERWFESIGNKPVPGFQQPPFIPFQYGPRLCLGMNMAYLEIKVMAVLILKRFTLKNVAARPPAVQRALTLAVRDGMWMTVEPRV